MSPNDYTTITEALDAMEQGDYQKLEALTEEQVAWMKKVLAYLQGVSS